MISFPWESGQFEITNAQTVPIHRLSPLYPPILPMRVIINLIEEDLESLELKIKKAERIVLIIEDPSRISNTAEITGVICRKIKQMLGRWSGFEVVAAAGAHFQINNAGLLKKTGQLTCPLSIHDCKDRENLILIGYSRLGIPFVFNQKVVHADLRLSISTVNLHPLAGFSGGGKILLPGVAGLDTIENFHRLPAGEPGAAHTAMRDLIDEILTRLPIAHSWHLLSNPEGEIFHIQSGVANESFSKASAELIKWVSVSAPEHQVPILVLGCQPFNQNLIGTFKSLHQVPKLLQPGGLAVLINEAPQGIGFHHWRTQHGVIETQKNHYDQLLKGYQIAVFAPNSSASQFDSIFPGTFQLIHTMAELKCLFQSRRPHEITAVPYAPITLFT